MGSAVVTGGAVTSPPGTVVWILRILTAHLDSKEPVARLCDYLNLSQSTLYRRFRAEIGVGPLDRFQELRMNEAKRLLSEEGVTVKEAAFRLGYSHFNDLSRAYRKHFGKSPSFDR